MKEVRLPTDGSQRLKGFGYAELDSVASLLDAMELTGEVRPHPPIIVCHLWYYRC